MTTLANAVAMRPMVLRLSTAAELMTRNPLSLDKSLPISAAIALLDSTGLAEAPMVDELNRPEGVVARAACTDWQEFGVRSSPYGVTSEGLDQTTIAQIANPIIKTVHSDDHFREVIEKLLRSRLRRVYVVNDAEELIGVVSITDVLRHLLVGDDGQRV
jgi:CBS domain-containing protein